MPLTSGTRLGSFEVLVPLGAGGMGEVYRARDTRLDRDVAMKVLPPDFTGDPERLARFGREAKLLAQLHHPNIASIFGLAKALDPAGTSSAGAMSSPTLTARATQAGVILGTAAYMAPEQARGRAEAVEKDPERRYGSAAAVSEDVERYLSSRPIRARPPSALYQLRTFAGRNQVLVTGVAVVLGEMGQERRSSARQLTDWSLPLHYLWNVAPISPRKPGAAR